MRWAAKDTVRIRQNSNGFRIYIDETLKSNSEDDLFEIESVDSVLEFRFENFNTTGSITLLLLDGNGKQKANKR